MTAPNALNAHGLAEAISYALTHGIIISKDRNTFGVNISHAPFTYLPSPVNSQCFQKAIDVTPALNRLIHAISQDRQYLQDVLAETAQADPDFTGRLYRLFLSVKPTDIQLAIARFDYFIQNVDDIPSLRMVEMNCISASFAGLGSQISALHRHIGTNPACGITIDPNSLPANDSLTRLCEGISITHQLFASRYEPPLPCVVLMIVQPGELNSFDQYMIQSSLWTSSNITVVRSSLASLSTQCKLDESGFLRINPVGIALDEAIVSVVYFRAGYTPNDYPSEKEWSGRELLERSNAVKCPSVAMQLVGTKKIQQVLDLPGHVERFISDETEAKAIRSTFTKQYSLSANEDVEDTVRMALDRPGDFVLKPQREGGGNNLYGDDVKIALTKMTAPERSAYVLMDRICPVQVENVIVRDGQHQETTVVSELGIFGVHVVDGEKVINFAAGSLLRSKAASQEDGGVAAGVAVLDSPMLVD